MAWLATFEDSYAKGRVGYMSVMIIFQSAIGALAAMESIRHDAWVLVSISAILSMGSNAMFLANMKPRIAVGVFLASSIISSIILFMWLLIG